MKKLYLLILLVAISLFAVSQSVTHINPANVRLGRLVITNMPEGSQADSVLVKSGNWMGRTTMGGQFVVNLTTLGLSKAQLNSAYPNVPIGYRVICPGITLGGATYTKATENGNNDVWVMASTPPVL